MPRFKGGITKFLDGTAVFMERPEDAVTAASHQPLDPSSCGLHCGGHIWVEFHPPASQLVTEAS